VVSRRVFNQAQATRRNCSPGIRFPLCVPRNFVTKGTVDRSSGSYYASGEPLIETIQSVTLAHNSAQLMERAVRSTFVPLDMVAASPDLVTRSNSAGGR